MKILEIIKFRSGKNVNFKNRWMMLSSILNFLSFDFQRKEQNFNLEFQRNFNHINS